MKPSPERTKASAPHRQLRIALNASLEIRRDAVCRLARDPDSWLDERDPALAARLEVSPADLCRARHVARNRSSIARSELAKAAAMGVTILTLTDDGYPEPLAGIPLSPAVLYVLGHLETAPAIAIVGSRRATASGLETARLFARELAGVGLTVISGFARGIDSAAHRGALEAPGGRTIAVLGCGLDILYPRRHTRLRDRVRSHGALVSEFPFSTAPLARNFPVRNRIIASLTLGTLVVQAAPRSGSLITAHLALELGKEVWAIPGPIFQEIASGPNTLIRDGALLVQSPRDILESLPIAVRDRLQSAAREPRRKTPAGPAGTILETLAPGQSLTIDEVARLANMPVDRALAALLELELSGSVRQVPGQRYLSNEPCRRSNRLW